MQSNCDDRPGQHKVDFSGPQHRRCFGWLVDARREGHAFGLQPLV
jgi:hypothetical protein